MNLLTMGFLHVLATTLFIRYFLDHVQNLLVCKYDQITQVSFVKWIKIILFFGLGFCYGASFVAMRLNDLMLFVYQLMFVSYFYNYLLPLSILLGILFAAYSFGSILVGFFAVIEIMEFIIMHTLIKRINITKNFMHIRFLGGFFITLFVLLIHGLQIYSSSFVLNLYKNYNLSCSEIFSGGVWSQIKLIFFSSFKNFNLANFNDIFFMSENIMLVILVKNLYYNIGLLRWSQINFVDFFSNRMPNIYYYGLWLSLLGASASLLSEYYFLSFFFYGLIVCFSSYFCLFFLEKLFKSYSNVLFWGVLIIFDNQGFVFFFVFTTICGILFPYVSFIKNE